jgi:hypothetical protein
MQDKIDRRDFLKLAAVGGGAVFMSSLAGGLRAASAAREDFYFVQLSDVHWGFHGPAVNPDSEGTLSKAIAAVNALPFQPDFIVFTGDLTHTIDDPRTRRGRLIAFRELAGGLKNKNVHFLPGEHDASLDHGQAFKEVFGATYYSFDHKGVHFIAVDNVSDPAARIGDDQLEWLRNDLGRQTVDTPIVVFTHRPLFDLYPQWDWATRDGAKAIELLKGYKYVTVFYGHIHQEHHQMTGHIAHHSAKSLMFPLPAPGTQPKREPVRWDPAHPYRGLGFRSIEAEAQKTTYELTEYPLTKA